MPVSYRRSGGASVTQPVRVRVLLNFDALASQFDSQRGLPQPALAAWMKAVNGIASGVRLNVVEPGIGTGRIALPLAMVGHAVTGADISAAMLATCAESAAALGVGEHLTLIQADAVYLPLPDQWFDLGVIAQLLYLVPDWPAVLDELARLVKPGGHVVHLTEPTREGANLRRWSGAWREMIESTGYRHTALSPTDAEVRAEFQRRWPDVEVQELASWEFGQSVSQAMDSYAGRLRPLYMSVSDDDWRKTSDRFLQWASMEFPDKEARLEGTVTLTAMIAAV